MPSLNILDLRDTHEVGGPGKTILETYRALDATRYRQHLAVFLRNDERDDSPFICQARALGMPVHVIRGAHQFDPRLIERTAALVKRLGIEIVHAHEVKSDVIALLSSLRHRARTMTTLHGWIGNSRRQQFFIALDKRAVRHFDCVVAVSSRLRQQALDAGVPEHRLRLVHNAIVLDHYKRTGRSGGLAALAGRTVARPVLACVGRISPEKGQIDLIEALRMVRERGGRISAVLAGDGPDRAAVESRVREAGLTDSVHLLGYIDPPQQVLDEADLLVLPSHTEGLPNAALEAMAMHVPVLATSVGGTPDVVTDGATGRLVPPGEPARLADALMDFLADEAPWRVMADRALTMVAERFDFSARTRALEHIYDELGAARP